MIVGHAINDFRDADDNTFTVQNIDDWLKLIESWKKKSKKVGLFPM